MRKAAGCRVQGQRRLLTLNGWDQPLQLPMRYAMTFIGVTAGGALPAGVSIKALEDLGYFEMEALEAGIEFRMLFQSGIAWTIRCRNDDVCRRRRHGADRRDRAGMKAKRMR